MRGSLPTFEALPDPVGPPTGSSPRPSLLDYLEDLIDRTRAYVEATSSTNACRAYASDWKHFSAWCRHQNVSPLPPDPRDVGLSITACASGAAERGMNAIAVSTIERRLSVIGWYCGHQVVH